MNNSELILFLFSVKGIGKQSILRLYREFGSFASVYNASEEDLKDLIRPATLLSFLETREKISPGQILSDYQKSGISFYTIMDEKYPRRLLRIPDAPLGIFVKGELPKNHELTAAVIGARHNSYYGEKQTKAIAKKLTENGIAIVSGMARGIDGISQRVALENKGKTYAVLGCGVNVCYPPENRYLFDRIPGSGGLISEYLPDIKPCGGYFPMRNRIISGLGDALIVTESRAKSGTLITVDMALEQGREIFALPGRVDDPLSIGCNKLIAQGAHMITDLDELVEVIKRLPRADISAPVPAEDIMLSLLSSHGLLNDGTDNSCSPSRDSSCHQNMNSPIYLSGECCLNENTASSKSFSIKEIPDIIMHYKLSKEEGILLSLLDYAPQSMDTLLHKLNDRLKEEKEHCPNLNASLTIAEVSSFVMNLCFQGLARQENGSWYTKP